MARLTSLPPVIGTIGPVTIYEMFNWYYMRSRSSLTAERVKTDPAFRKFMHHANLMAVASPISSAVYALIPIQRRKHGLRNKITGEAMTWLKYQWTREETIDYLTKKYAGAKPPPCDGVCTKLRPDYRVRLASRERTAGRPSRKLCKTTPFSLIEWRRRDASFRSLPMQRAMDYNWQEAVAKLVNAGNTGTSKGNPDLPARAIR